MTVRRCPAGLVNADHGDILQFNKSDSVDGWWETKSLLELFGRDFIIVTDTFPTTHGTGSATSGYSTLGWTFDTAGVGSVNPLDGVAGHPGIVRITTGAVPTTNRFMCLPTNAGVTGGPFMLDDVKAFQWIARIALATGRDVYFGLGDNANSLTLGTNSIYFATSQSIDSGAFHVHSRVAGASTEDDLSSVDPAGGDWFILTMVKDSSGNFNWDINAGASTGQIPAADVPTGVAMTPVVHIDDQDIVNAVTVDVDEFTIVLEPSNSRHS